MTSPTLPTFITTARVTHARRCWRERRLKQLHRHRRHDRRLYNQILNVCTFIVLGLALALLAFA